MSYNSDNLASILQLGARVGVYWKHTDQLNEDDPIVIIIIGDRGDYFVTHNGSLIDPITGYFLNEPFKAGPCPNNVKIRTRYSSDI